MYCKLYKVERSKAKVNTQYHKKISFACWLFLISFFFSITASAHPVVNYAMEHAPAKDVVWYYIKMGVVHIIPYGFDHILFVTSLCLLSTKIKTILWQASAFTVAHSITLALSMKNIIVAPSPVVEPVIALSIVFVALENILLSELKPWRVLIVFFFGLVHGLGFASALNSVGLPQNKFFTSVIAFNIGVEIGQITIILLVFGLIVIPLGKSPNYKKRVVYPLSFLIALIAGYWTIQRINLI
jgi:hypothetical protein